MSHSIAEIRQRNPMWYFERNYAALLHMLEDFRVFDDGSAEIELPVGSVHINILEETRYTFLLELRQCFPGIKDLVPEVVFKVRLYLDARLAEVVSYQGQQYLKARYQVPNKSMYHPDEKRQTNLLLYDWLSACGRLNYNESSVMNFQN